MIEAYRRGVQPVVEQSKLRESSDVAPIVVSRFTHIQRSELKPETDIEIEIVYVRVNLALNNNDWHRTSIGRLKVDPLISAQKRDRELQIAQIHFDEGSELGQKRDKGRRLKQKCFREIVIDENGHGWQELRREKLSKKQKKAGIKSRPKWLYVVFNQSPLLEQPSLQDGM